MITPTAANPNYASGWAVNSRHDWWHPGFIPGTTSIGVRTHSNFCWAALANTHFPSPDMPGELDNLIWKMARTVKARP